MTRSFRDVVADHHTDSDAVLLASREPCISIAYDEQANVHGRSFRIVTPDALEDLDLRDSWIMAVLLCPGDDTETVATWTIDHGRDPRRIIFYFHEETDPTAALGAWRKAQLPVHATWTIRDWKELHKHFGAAWNVQVYDDFRHG